MNMRMNWPELAIGTPGLIPPVSMADIQTALAETGLMIEHLYQLGLISTWLLMPEAFETCMSDRREVQQIRLALEVPAEVESDQLIYWMQESAKFGWLIRADVFLNNPKYSPSKRAAGGWFYNERLDLALMDAIKWAKGGES